MKISSSRTLLLAFVYAVAGCLLMPGQSSVSAHATDVQASQFHTLSDMVKACMAIPGDHCTLVVSTPQTITLGSAYTLPKKIELQFSDGGMWTLNGKPLTVGSGLLKGPDARQIFAGTGDIRGLQVARPEWFSPGSSVYPANALAQAYRSTIAWGTILLNDATYTSPFYAVDKESLAPFVTPRRFLGVKRPQVDDEQNPHRLIDGTIIRGAIYSASVFQGAHLGVDVGPDVVQELYGGSKPNGIFLPTPGGFNPKRGTRLEDISVLTNNADGQHSVLIEGDDGAFVDGLWIWTPGGTHGLVLKSSHTFVHNFHCKGASSDCLIVKSDYKTAGNGLATDDRLEDIFISALVRPGDTGGIEMDARWDDIARVSFENVREQGLSYALEADSSWFYGFRDIEINHLTASGLTGGCIGPGPRPEIRILNSECTDAHGRLPLYVQPRLLSIGARAMEFIHTFKTHLRILWVTACTLLRRLAHWFGSVCHFRKSQA
jgi:hypothetical protein